MKIKINLLAIFLIALGVSALVYRIYTYHYSLFPIVTAKTWQVEVVERDYGVEEDKSLKKYELLLPNRDLNPKILSEKIRLPDSGISIIEEESSRILSWVKRKNNQIESFHYIVDFRQGIKGVPFVAGKKLSNFIKKNFTNKQQDAISKIFSNRQFNKLGTQELSSCLREDFCKSLHGLKIRPLKEVKLTVAYAYLLNKKGYLANVALGFSTIKAQKKAKFYSWVRAIIKKKKYNFYIDRSQSINTGDQLVFWNYLAESDFNSINKNFNFSLVPLEPSIAPMKLSQKKHDWFHNVFSLDSLPLGVQIVYQHMLLIPIGALIVCIFRLILGVKVFGTFMPVLLAFALSQVGYQAGFIMLFLIIISGTFFRALLNNISLLSVARISSNLVFVVLLIIIISKISWHNNYIFGFSATLFPIIVIAMMIERMSIMISEVGLISTFKTLFATLVLAVVIKEAMELPLLRYWSFYFLEIHLVTLGMIILIGRYTGYRVSELIRFKDLIKK